MSPLESFIRDHYSRVMSDGEDSIPDCQKWPANADNKHNDRDNQFVGLGIDPCNDGDLGMILLMPKRQT